MTRLRDFLLPRIGRTHTAIVLTAVGFTVVGLLLVVSAGAVRDSIPEHKSKDDEP